MAIRFDFKRPDKGEFQKLLMTEVGKEVKKYIPQAVNKMKKPIKLIIQRAFSQNSTYKSMLNDDSSLTGSLGVESFDRAAEAIVDYIVSTVIVEPTNRVKVGPNEVSVGVRVTLLGGTGNFTDAILQEPSLQGLIQYATDNGYVIPWLEWLLTRGDGVIISDYFVRFGDFRSPKPSRTGLAIMVHADGFKYRVPTQHSGTQRDNFITRVLDKPSLLDDIGEIIENTLEKFLKDL